MDALRSDYRRQDLLHDQRKCPTRFYKVTLWVEEGNKQDQFHVYDECRLEMIQKYLKVLTGKEARMVKHHGKPSKPEAEQAAPVEG